MKFSAVRFPEANRCRSGADKDTRNKRVVQQLAPEDAIPEAKDIMTLFASGGIEEL